MKTCKTIVGGLCVLVAAVFAILYFTTNSDQPSAIAVALFQPENVTQLTSRVTGAFVISEICLFATGVVSLISRNSNKTKYNVIMIILGAVTFLVALMYSLLIPALTYVSIMGILALMFAVSYGCIDLDYNGAL